MKKLNRVLLPLLFMAMLVMGMATTASASTKATINKTSMTIWQGDTQTLKVSNATVSKWTSSNTKVASVSRNGVVKGLTGGQSVIQATTKKGTFKCRVTVHKLPQISAKTLKLEVGSTRKLTVSNAYNYTPVWKSSNRGVATVDSGYVKAVKAGTATITVSCGNKHVSCSVTVVKKPSTTVGSSAESSYAIKNTTTGMTAQEKEAFKKLYPLQGVYKEGMPWTNAKYEEWNGGIYRGGYGCAGFAFKLSDVAFGTKLATKHTDYSKIKVGDVLRMDNNSHSVIVMQKDATGIIVGEGNYNGKVHWGRHISNTELKKSLDFVLTRY